MKKDICLATSLMFLVFTIHSQHIEFVDAVLHEPNNTIEITYNLTTSGKDQLYNISLYYSNDGGQTFNGPLARVSGDVGIQVSGGTHKKIYWNYFYEDEEFTGKNLVFSVRAKEMTLLSSTVLMGPTAALYSVVVPGWGDYKVRTGKNYWLYTAGTWGLISASLIARFSANTAYNDYLNASDVASANEAFNKAERSYSTFQTLSAIGLVAWTADVVGVFIKGKQNEKKGLVERHQKWHWDLAVSSHQFGTTAGIKVRF